ncbi:hypothetical protein E3226_001385 [Legionella geestiana]|uniref:hypothetical protein n=1 Tax=Legionella geestiana TaxID=45065 RepID=UPI0010918A76|nr:hypothetical protein [Legionella geestiana]QDQ39154.1 hypothetical protein E3226_001385 [Legionella geestiana]
MSTSSKNITDLVAGNMDENTLNTSEKSQADSSTSESSREVLTPFDVSVRIGDSETIRQLVIKNRLKWPELLNTDSINQICEMLSTNSEAVRNETRSLFVKLLEQEEAQKLVKIVGERHSFTNLQTAVSQLPAENRKEICTMAHVLTNKKTLDRQKMSFLAKEAGIAHPVKSDIFFRGIYTGVERAIEGLKSTREIIREIKKIPKKHIPGVVLEDGRTLLDIVMTSAQKDVVDAVLKRAGYKRGDPLESAFQQLSNNHNHYSTYMALTPAPRTRFVRRNDDPHPTMFEFDSAGVSDGIIEMNNAGLAEKSPFSAHSKAFRTENTERVRSITQEPEIVPDEAETVTYDTEFDKAIRNLYEAGVLSMQSRLSKEKTDSVLWGLNNQELYVDKAWLLSNLGIEESALSHEARAAFDVADAFQGIRDAVINGNGNAATTVKNEQNANINILKQASESIAIAANVLLTVFILPLLAAPLVKNGEWKSMRYTFFSEKTKVEKAVDAVEEEVRKNTPPNNG